MFDALGEILTEQETKFLAEILFDAWFALDVRNMDTEKRKMYSSIKSKIARLNNANDFLECDKCCTKIFDYDAFGESKYEIINNEILCVPCLEKGGFLNDN